MKKLIYLLFWFSFLFLNAKSPNRVVIIALDGISVEGFKAAKTPNIDALMSNGVLSLDTRVVMPSITLPNWTSHLTGSGPEQHGVFNNTWTLEKSQYPIPVKDNDGYYPSVFTLLKQNVKGMKTAFYYNWINLFYPYNEKYFDEISFLKNDAYKENYKKAFEFCLKNKKNPTVVFLYSVHTDHAGHKYKWMSDQYISSIEEADVEIGVFIDKMKTADLFNDTYFMFISDHGGINNGHGGVLHNEMIVLWGITGPKVRKGIKMDEPNNTVNTSAVILRIFKVKQPDAWISKVPKSVFK